MGTSAVVWEALRIAIVLLFIKFEQSPDLK